MSPHVALLRGINVGGHNRVPMVELRALCAGLGWHDVRTYIQSGNVLFRSAAPAEKCAGSLESAITAHFALEIPVVVRAVNELASYRDGNPFPDAAATEPNLLMLGLARGSLADAAVDLLRERATAGERIERTGDAIWIHFVSGAAVSKLSPALLDRAAGSPVTLRNWRTVSKLVELAGLGASPA
ncbi:MAG TPA: DUF1697 domain-containing protein [Longimicrobiales bacterium]|nr:DUF1697 domain-containing protein [Longimicrobiales bacterium]